MWCVSGCGAAVIRSTHLANAPWLRGPDMLCDRGGWLLRGRQGGGGKENRENVPGQWMVQRAQAPPPPTGPVLQLVRSNCVSRDIADEGNGAVAYL